MKLFCFASRSQENIWRGIRAGKWAVATVSNSAMAGRITKAREYFAPGARGVLYCNPLQSFTTPFIATSYADPTAVVTDVWPEPWVLPFTMQPLGDLRRCLHKDEAQRRWSVFVERLRDYNSVSAAMNITGTTVFVPINVPEEFWNVILEDLGIEADYPD